MRSLEKCRFREAKLATSCVAMWSKRRSRHCGFAQADPALVDAIADMMAKQPERRLATAAEVVERLRPWTSQADDKTWQELGRYALEPGERSYSGGGLADTSPAVTRGPLVGGWSPALRDSHDSKKSMDSMDSNHSEDSNDSKDTTDSKDSREEPGDRASLSTQVEPDAAAETSLPRMRGVAVEPHHDEPTGLAFLVVVLVFAALVIGLSAVTLVIAG